MSESADNLLFIKDTWGIYRCQLTLREYFAAAALQGLLAGVYPTVGKSEDDPELMAAWAVKFADALIAELGKPKQ